MQPINLEKQFDLIYTRYLSDIEHIAYNYLYNKEEAEDAAQEVFTSFWKNIESIDLNGNIFSYLFVSIRNVCLRKLQLVKLQQNHTKFLMSREDLSYLSLKESAASKLYSSEVDLLLSKALQLMPTKTKEAFLLQRQRDMTYKKIAEIQGVNIKNVEYRISSALKTLRIVFRDYLSFIIYISIERINNY